MLILISFSLIRDIKKNEFGLNIGSYSRWPSGERRNGFTSVFLGDEGNFKLHARPVLSTVDWVTTQINSPQHFSPEGILTALLF